MASHSARPVRFELEADPDFMGQTKSSGEKYGLTFKASGFYMSYVIVHAIHGLWDSSSSTASSKFPYASLIVIRFELAHDRSTKDRRFVAFNPILQLRTNPISVPRADPWVVHYEPAGQGTIWLSESESNLTNQKVVEVSADIKAQPSPIYAGAKYTNTTGEDYTRHKRYEIQSGGEVTQTRGGGRGGRDKVWWNATEDSNEKRGVGDRLQVAILVRQEKASRFMIDLTLKGHVDALYSLANAVQKARRPFHSMNKFELDFDPADSNVTILDGVDPHNLASAEKDGTLGKLSFEHSPEKISSTTFYGNAEIAPETKSDPEPVPAPAPTPTDVADLVVRPEPSLQPEAAHDPELAPNRDPAVASEPADGRGINSWLNCILSTERNRTIFIVIATLTAQFLLFEIYRRT